MPLVEALAHRHDRRGAEHEDLVQAGSIGLLGAIERYDPKLGEEFAAFAVPTIAGEMKRHLRDRTDTVRLPRRLHEARLSLPKRRAELTARLGRAPTADELAAAAELSTEELAQLESAPGGASDQLAAENGESELDASEARLLLADAFRSLDDMERTIIYLRFIRERSRREVADELKMSPSALTRRTSVALAKLRSELEGRAFERGAPALEVAGVAFEAEGEAAAGQAGEPVAGEAAEPGPVPAVEPAAELDTETQPAAAGHTPGKAGGAEPKARASHSGRLMLRMPQSLHAELAEAAEREDVSLNQYITNTLSASLGWHASEQRPASTPRWLPAALVTNIVVVVIAGLVALVLLLVAWQQGW